MTYLVLLLAVALVSGTLAAAATLWSHAQRREREAQLLWAGDQFRRALLAYAQAGNGVFPQRLEDLLDDPRSPKRRRFLRRIYDDPMTRSIDWAVVRDERGAIVGVHSRSLAEPIKTGRFPAAYAGFAGARTYAEWTFSAVATPPRTGLPSAPAGPASGAAGSRSAGSTPAPDRREPASSPAISDPPARAAPSPGAKDESRARDAEADTAVAD